MLCSVIIPTVGRQTLTRAVESVLSQSLPASEVEVIVVNDSGLPVPEADWQKSERVQIINTNRRERSVARNTGASIAKGEFLQFLDDDDWLAPDALQHLWNLSRTSHARWLYGITQLVDRQHAPLIRLRHGLTGNCFVQAMAGEWIPLQASWIDRKMFLQIGGFDPLLSGPEDIDLLRRALLVEELDETPNLVAYVIMGGPGSTTDYDRHPQASRAARENILSMSNVFQRMRASAVNPAWHGRMARVYLTSVVWNLQRGYLFACCSRIFFSMASMLTAGSGIVSKDFWRAVSKPYDSITFAEGIREAQKAK